MPRYWAIRTDQARRAFIWTELLDGRLRQGWGDRARRSRGWRGESSVCAGPHVPASAPTPPRPTSAR